MVKGFTRDQKFVPISDYKKVRKSSGKTIIPSGVKLKKSDLTPKGPIYSDLVY